MPKPSVITWSTDTNYTDPGKPWDGKPTKVEPAADRKTAGWKPKDKPPAQHWNWFKNLVGQWTAWLDAGVWEAVSLALSGGLTAGGDVEATNLYFTSTQTKQLDIHGTDYGSFGGAIAEGYRTSSGAAQVHDVVIELPLLSKIWGYSFRYYGNGVDNLTHKLVKITDGVTVDVGTATIVAPAAAWATAFNNFAPEDVVLGTRYAIRVTAGGSGQRVGAPTVDWTFPKP